MCLCSTEKTAAHAQRLARAGVAPSPSPSHSRQSHEPLPAPYVKRAARDIPTGPRGKRERRMVHPAFGLDSHREQVCLLSASQVERCHCPFKIARFLGVSRPVRCSSADIV